MTGTASFVSLPGPQTIPLLPAYIPEDVDIDTVKAEVAACSVSAPATEVPDLRQVVHEASDDGIDLKIVVIQHDPGISMPLRDIATVVGSDYSDVTVLVLSPSYAGTYSTRFDRVTLEAGEDVAKTGNPVQSSHNFVSQLTTPGFPWTAFTIVLLVVVIAAVIGTRIMQLRAKRSAATVDGTGQDA